MPAYSNQLHRHIPTFTYNPSQVTKLKMYPYFDLAHAALCCLAVRDDLANGIIVMIFEI